MAGEFLLPNHGGREFKYGSTFAIAEVEPY